ncbi:helix-turn-helix domain-containing protein [Chryseobacterium sp.]|jgi:AraC-like DNA-binding protein|uniref:helix-turn-helix domain-containing protein n=1 Tax=Chryseobacterium sp. TaxID=1871047 RepID=UPI00284D50A8|nr:helix-turn-helix domain-containing protein [Chryseobacterium sp.]MDR3025023.1 helix-turn-helix domain-containing protein [Chryseobacterium sp.]
MKTLKPKERKGQFRVAKIGENKCTLESYNRRDFYKISLVTKGWPPCQLCYGALAPIEVDKPALVLLNPLIPHSWVVPKREIESEGYFCVFDHDFISHNTELNGLANQMFNNQKSPVYFPDDKELSFLSVLFARMRTEADLSYNDKDNLFRSHLNLLFHEALQIRQDDNQVEKGSSRIAGSFFSMLRKQFPVDLPLQPIKLKTASDFADLLAVHVNHLNTAVTKASGKSTTTHINELIFAEAKSLLSYTTYSVSEISFGLGFEYQSYFTRFFRKFAGITPSEFRNTFEKYK